MGAYFGPASSNGNGECGTTGIDCFQTGGASSRSSCAGAGLVFPRVELLAAGTRLRGAKTVGFGLDLVAALGPLTRHTLSLH